MMSPRDLSAVPEAARATIHTARIALPGELAVPAAPHGAVVIAHASGRHPLDPDVATALFHADLATLSVDLLTEAEDAASRYPRQPSTDSVLLGRRLEGAIAWLASQPTLRALPIGLVGSDDGVAAALSAAAAQPLVRAVVVQGGRPELAAAVLPNVSCPVLLIAGSEDAACLAAVRTALERLNAASQLHVVLGAGPTFDAPGARAEARTVALRWFRAHLTPAAAQDEWDH